VPFHQFISLSKQAKIKDAEQGIEEHDVTHEEDLQTLQLHLLHFKLFQLHYIITTLQLQLLIY
jgi:hypothetical protein